MTQLCSAEKAKHSEAAAALEKWLRGFMQRFGLKGWKRGQYTILHLTRKVLVWRSLSKRKFKNVGEAQQALRDLDSKHWLPRRASKAKLGQLAPDSKGLLQTMPPPLRVQQVCAYIGKVDLLLLSMWLCLISQATEVLKKQGWSDDRLLAWVDSSAGAMAQAAEEHAARVSNGGVPIALCPANVVRQQLELEPEPEAAPARPAENASGGDPDGEQLEEMEAEATPAEKATRAVAKRRKRKRPPE